MSLGGTNAGESDAYLRKYDSAGNELWTHQFGTSVSDVSYSVAVDAVGGVYITGDTSGSLEGTNAGGKDAFLVKYDSAGNELWTHQLGTSVDDNSYSVAVDSLGGVYITGDTSGSLGGTNAGGKDAFLVKFSAVRPGDFDQDGDSDGRDFLAWQRDPSVGNLNDWQTNYGNSDSLTVSGLAVPEPCSFALLAFGSVLLPLQRRRRAAESVGVGRSGLGCGAGEISPRQINRPASADRMFQLQP